jgi:5-methylcytosine-specific restriction protein A
MSIIDRDKIVFVTLDWMKFYKGITEDDIPLGTGGRYPKDQKHEIYNFLEEDGKCYGYTPPYGKINLKEICASGIKINPDGYKYIDNVLVVFIGSKKDGKKRRVVGFYLDAIVFNKCYENKNPKRIIHSNNTFAGYNVIAEAENAFLFAEDAERKIEIPYSRTDGFGYGMHNVWYAPKYDSRIIDFRNRIIMEIEAIVENTNNSENHDDERKYIEGGVTKSVKEVSRIQRNADAKRKCLDYYFKTNEHYKCQICGFDFEATYGETGKHFIEVHHIKSLVQISKEIGEHEIDPEKDLIPVCSNCHSIIHRKKPPIEIEEMKNFIKTSINIT